MVEMNDRKRASVWLTLSLLGLTGLLISRSFQPDWLEPIGLFFLSGPILATVLTVKMDLKNDPVTTGSIMVLVVLFGLTWLF